MADDERCSPLIDVYSNSTSTVSTTHLLFTLGNEISEVTTATTWSNDAEYSLVSTEKLIEEALYRVVIIVVCVIGLVCNIINIIVLSRKSLNATMERLERSAHYGLVGKCLKDIFSAFLATLS